VLEIEKLIGAREPLKVDLALPGIAHNRRGYHAYLVVFLIHWSITALLTRQLPPSLKPGISRFLSNR